MTNSLYPVSFNLFQCSIKGCLKITNETVGNGVISVQEDYLYKIKKKTIMNFITLTLNH